VVFSCLPSIVPFRLAFASLLLLSHFAILSVSAAVQDQHLIKPASVETQVSFQAKDGWELHGTLTLPKTLDRRKVPGALLIPGGEHDQSVFDTYPGWAKIQEYIATLRFDLRGTGKSSRPLKAQSFTSEQRNLLYLDVKAALEFLESQPNVDTTRIGVVAEESGADPAVLGAAGDPHVKVMVFLSGRLGVKAKEYLQANDQIALLAVVSKEDQPGFRSMTDVYFGSRNESSDIMVFDDLGIGAAMGSVWRDKFPNQKPIDFTLGEWLVSRLTEHGNEQEVSFSTADGYTLHADVILPSGATIERKVPAAVLLHSALGDRQIFKKLSQMLVRNGIAVLSLDWRGRGQSTEKGYYFDLSKQDREQTPLDVRAAVDYIASQDVVDANNIGIVGLVLSAKYGMLEAAKDNRIKTFVVMTGFLSSEAEKQSINSLKFPVLYLLSGGRPQVSKAMMEHYALTRSYGSQMFLHDSSEHGFHLLKTDRSLEPLIVQWLKTQLSTH